MHLINATPLLDWNVKNAKKNRANLNFLTCPSYAVTSHPTLHTFLIEAVLPSLRFSDIILATILATKSDICGKKFELKIDNVRFVGHPTLLQHPPIIQVRKKKVPS